MKLIDWYEDLTDSLSISIDIFYLLSHINAKKLIIKKKQKKSSEQNNGGLSEYCNNW